MSVQSVRLGILTCCDPIMRNYHSFQHREAVFRICCGRLDNVTAEILRQRRSLEDYIRRDPEFLEAFGPVPVQGNAPEVARRMAHAAERVDVGPMAAVAGAMAQLAVEAGLAAGAGEVIVDNGGDIYMVADHPVVVGLFAGEERIGGRLAFSIEPADTPLAVCSSSGRMGHSASMGDCDLATVVARDAALADAAATRAANLVRRPADIDGTLETIASIEGIDGVLLVKDDRIGITGRLPELVKR